MAKKIRYENHEDGHDKFWEVSPTPDGKFLAIWGKNGYTTPPKNKKVYTKEELVKKIIEKEAKGYRKV